MSLPKELIEKAKNCSCEVCRILVSSSHYNADVLAIKSEDADKPHLTKDEYTKMMKLFDSYPDFIRENIRKVCVLKGD